MHSPPKETLWASMELPAQNSRSPKNPATLDMSCYKVHTVLAPNAHGVRRVPIPRVVLIGDTHFRCDPDHWSYAEVKQSKCRLYSFT